MYEYQFPEKNPFRAYEATEPKFRIESQPNWVEKLFVDFGAERSESFRTKFDWALGIQNARLVNRSNSYRKIVFSGHMGSGKSIELTRYAQGIDDPQAYFVVPIDLELETQIQTLEAEDILVAMVTVLIKTLQKREVRFEEDDFAQIADEFLSDQEELGEVAKEYGFQAEAKATAGWSFWKFLSVEGTLKGAYGRSNKTTTIVRKAIKTNAKPILQKLNVALKGLRSALQHQQRGEDILFVIDGLEKANHEVYESLFVKDVQLITGIDAHIISTVPIDTSYMIEYVGAKDAFRTTNLPMLRLTPSSKAKLSSMVLKRADASLFGEGVLDRLIEISGGCPRILLKMVHFSIEKAGGQQVTLPHVEKVIREEGLERWKALTQKHRDVLKSGNFAAADTEILELLHSVSLLEYNGESIERKINPLILPFVKAMPA